jgi:hypothetical protein
MSKVGSHDPFGHLKHKLWPKEGLGVKLTIWLPTIKSQESPQYPCVQVACDISLKSSRQGIQLCFRLHFDQRFAHKVMRPQSCGSPNFGNFRTHTWESQDKMPLGWWSCGYSQGETLAGREAAAPSSIRIIDEIQWGEVMPPDGGIVRPENVQMKPFFPKGELNA